MPLAAVAAVVAVAFGLAYVVYGRLLARLFTLDSAQATPACTVNDGVDYVPTPKFLLLGQHFSAITAAGPIVGPILAGIWFGWGPALLWIVGGAIFFGSVHDFSSLIGSVRHGARSVAEIVGEHMGRRAYLLFLGFIWLSLIYVIIAFTDLTSASFVEPTLGGGVASSSIMYLLLGIVMGLLLRTGRVSLPVATAIFLPLVGLAVWCGQRLPVMLPPGLPIRPVLAWDMLLLGYCCVASVMPVWLLLQPRGYLGGWFLYAALFAGCVGLFFGGETVDYPAFIGMQSAGGVPLFPMLFVTIACGACSGFHGIVSSGTTSKQIQREPDCRAVGYGVMLLEGVVAVIALATVMILAPGDPLLSMPPDRIYAAGLGRFVQRLGISAEFAGAFALLAFTTFIYDTLDVATRLGRYILQELTGWRGWWGRVGATLATLALPAICVGTTITDAQGRVVPAWKAFWVLFGTSNQLLAALTLLGLTMWFVRLRKPWWVLGIPMVFMSIVTLWALTLTFGPWLLGMATGQRGMEIVGFVALVLSALAVLLLVQGFRSWLCGDSA